MFKVGDKVRVKRELDFDIYCVTGDMIQYRGQDGIITTVLESTI